MSFRDGDFVSHGFSIDADQADEIEMLGGRLAELIAPHSHSNGELLANALLHAFKGVADHVGGLTNQDIQVGVMGFSEAAQQSLRKVGRRQ